MVQLSEVNWHTLPMIDLILALAIQYWRQFTVFLQLSIIVIILLEAILLCVTHSLAIFIKRHTTVQPIYFHNSLIAFTPFKWSGNRCGLMSEPMRSQVKKLCEKETFELLNSYSVASAVITTTNFRLFAINERTLGLFW